MKKRYLMPITEVVQTTITSIMVTSARVNDPNGNPVNTGGGSSDIPVGGDNDGDIADSKKNWSSFSAWETWE